MSTQVSPDTPPPTDGAPVGSAVEPSQRVTDTGQPRIGEVVGAAARFISQSINLRSRGDQERRSKRRRAIMAPALLYIGSTGEKAVIFNVSEGGALISTWSPLLVGEMIDLSIPEERFYVSGKVVCTRPALRHICFGAPIPTFVVDELERKYFPQVFILAEAEHQIIVDRLAEAAAGRVKLGPSDLPDRHSCQLGRWYDSIADQELVGREAFRVLEGIHQAFHEKALEVCAAIAAADQEAVRNSMSELTNATTNLSAATSAVCRKGKTAAA